MADSFLSAHGLTLHYGGSQILNGIDFDAAMGEVTCVMGTNGVGKTSLLKALSGTHPRSGGDYTLDGQTVGREKAFDLARRGVAYVPQGREIFPFLTVRENLETGFAADPVECGAVCDPHDRYDHVGLVRRDRFGRGHHRIDHVLCDFHCGRRVQPSGHATGC